MAVDTFIKLIYVFTVEYSLAQEQTNSMKEKKIRKMSVKKLKTINVYDKYNLF